MRSLGSGRIQGRLWRALGWSTRNRHLGLELRGEDVAELLVGEPLDVEGAQTRQVYRAVGPDREGAAEPRDAQQLDLQGVARAEDVAIEAEAGSLGCRHSWALSSRAARRGADTLRINTALCLRRLTRMRVWPPRLFLMRFAHKSLPSWQILGNLGAVMFWV